MCFGRSKEPSHRDGSFEYPKYMLWPRNEKTRDNLSSKFPRRVCSATVTSENLNFFKASSFLGLCAKILYPYNCTSAQARVGIKPGFYHKAQPGGFYGFYEGGFLGFYGFYVGFMYLKVYLITSTTSFYLAVFLCKQHWSKEKQSDQD